MSKPIKQLAEKCKTVNPNYQKAIPILACIAGYADDLGTTYNNSPYISTIAQELGMAQATVYKYLPYLVAEGFLMIDKQEDEQGEVNNFYVLDIEKMIENVIKQRKKLIVECQNLNKIILISKKLYKKIEGKNV